MYWRLIFLVCFLALLTSCISQKDSQKYTSWEVYGGGSESIRYSSLSQIDTSNVAELEVAWIYQTGDTDSTANTQIQTNSIIIDGTLYGISPRMKLFALDAATGDQKWEFDVELEKPEASPWSKNKRGVMYWADGDDRRIFHVIEDNLYAIDAQTGKPIESFGEKGKTPLNQGLGKWSEGNYVTATSPGIIYKDLIIMGLWESQGINGAPGHIRAFNVRSGELEWVFHTVPKPGEVGYLTWEDSEAWMTQNGANNWAGMALDKERGIVYVPTGAVSPDLYGGERKGANLFANTLLALDAATGERVWHYQTIHHDVWDRDLPSPPSLVTVQHDGEKIDAVAQTTKTGFVFLFNRETGEPLFPIEEQPVTQSKLKGEETWLTQPVPTKPEPFARQHMGKDDINPYVSEQTKSWIRDSLKKLDSDHMYAPPSVNGTLIYPGFDGGAEWGGNAYDPETGLLYVNSNQVPWVLSMRSLEDIISKEQKSNPFAFGEVQYSKNCASCHGGDLGGGRYAPVLKDIGQRYRPGELVNIIENGSGVMPGFKNRLAESEVKGIINFLLKKEHYQAGEMSSVAENGDQVSTDYITNVFDKFRTPGDHPEGDPIWSPGYPVSSPPWGTLNAINLNTGEYAWRIPLGEYPGLKSKGIPPTGTENYGGPVVTRGGLVFIAATPDKKIRAFHKATGELLWEHELPAAGFATPSIYQVDGIQYLVIACGGGKLGALSGDEYIAFVLPESKQ